MHNLRLVEKIEQEYEASDRRLMIFDLSIRGHHPSYIKYLLRYWLNHERSGSLYIVVSPQFIDEHTDVVALADRDTRQSIHFVAISPQEETNLSARKNWLNRWLRSFQEWQLFCRYASQLEVSTALLMYFDSFARPIALGIKSPCPFSGLYFRPTFHYKEFSTTTVLPKKIQLQQWWDKVLISQVLKHPDWHTLFSMDPLALKQLEQFRSSATVVHLPDPIEIDEANDFEVTALKQQLAIEPGRQVFLLFGALTTRKGIHQILDAASQLPLEYCERLCILMIGESNLQVKLNAQIAEICRSKPIQFIQNHEFVPDSMVPAYFQIADVVLATYQYHVGSSGILLWAAAAQKPVLSSDYGLMGELVRRYRLGMAVDSTLPAEIAKGFIYFLTKPLGTVGDRTQMKTFAQQNSVEQYAQTIFKHAF